jgi:hypothetical protein
VPIAHAGKAAPACVCPAAATHCASPVAWSPAVVDPSGHRAHCAFEAAALYVPFSHAEHESSALAPPLYPASHSQLAAEMLAAADALSS